LDHWRSDEDNGVIDGMLPKVALVDWTLDIPVRATSKGVPGNGHAPDGVAFWMRSAADHGMEPTQIRVTHSIELAIVPGPSGRPIPAFLERYKTQIGDIPLKWRSIGEGYFVFTWETDDIHEHNALLLDIELIDPNSVPWMRRAMREAADGDGASRLRTLSSQSMADILSTEEASAIERSYDRYVNQQPSGLDHLLEEDAFQPSHSPSRTVAARIERNLAFLPPEERPDVLLERAAISFHNKVEKYERKMRNAYAQAADSALECWNESAGSNDEA
jgi:hypothetical protein